MECEAERDVEGERADIEGQKERAFLESRGNKRIKFESHYSGTRERLGINII